MKAYQTELEEKKKETINVRDDVDRNSMQFIQVDGIEKEKKMVRFYIFYYALQYF